MSETPEKIPEETPSPSLASVSEKIEGGAESASPPGNLGEQIEASKEAIANGLAEPTRNKGGRPIKHGRYSKKGKLPATPGAAVSPGNGNPAPVALPETLPPLTPFMGKLAGFPFGIAANRTGFDGYRLTEAEENQLGPWVDACAKTYFPQLESRHAPAVGLAFAVVALAMGKMQLHVAALEKEAIAKGVDPNTGKPLAETPAPGNTGFVNPEYPPLQ